MKPHVICLMAASVDGRTLHSRWRPEGLVAGGLFERLHDELGGLLIAVKMDVFQVLGMSTISFLKINS